MRELFGRIAPRYDLINDLQSFGLHRFWKRRLVTVADVRPGERALDLCCGTGDLAIQMRHADVEVIGCDFTREMLFQARSREDSITWIQGDALQLPFADAGFDLVTIGYGLRNLADLHTGLAEIFRVLKPGGRIAVLEFGKPSNRVWRELYFLYLRMCVPVLGAVFCGDAKAYEYILDSLRRYPSAGEVCALLKASGFTEPRFTDFIGGVMTIHRADKPR